MPKNTCQTLSEYSKELYLQEGATPESVKQKIDEFLEAGAGTDTADLNSKLKSVFPDYKAPDDPKIIEYKEQTHNLTKDCVSTAFACENSNIHKYDFGENGRMFYSILKPDNSDEHRAYNDEIVRIIKNGTPEERHELFLDITYELTSYNADELENMSDRDLGTRFASIKPVLNIAAERQNLLKAFKEMCDITPEEEEMFNTLAKPLEAETMNIYGRIDIITNPCYAHTDYTQIPEYELEKYDIIEDSLPFESEPSNFVSSVLKKIDAKTAAVKNNMNDSLKNIFGVDEEFTFTPNKNGDQAEGAYESVNRHLLDLKEGKTVYAYPASENNLPQEEKHVKAFRDFTGDGKLTEVPVPVKQPSGFVRFFHNIAKALRLPGISSCNKYDEYVQQVNELKTQAEAEAKASDPYAEYKEMMKKASLQKSERNMLRDKIAAQEKYNKSVEITESLMEGMVGPNADKIDASKIYNNFKKEDYQPEHLEFKKTEPLTDKDLTLVAFAGLSNTDCMNASGQQQDVPESARKGSLYVHIASDTILNPRAHISGYFDSLHAGRKKGAECLEEYSKGNKEPLAKLLGDAVKHQNSYVYSMSEYQEQSSKISVITNDMIDILKKDPELMDKSGLTKYDMDLAKAQLTHSELYQKGVNSISKICDAQYNGKELSQEEKENLITDYIISKTSTYLLSASQERLTKSMPEYDKCNKKIADAEKEIIELNKNVSKLDKNSPERDVFKKEINDKALEITNYAKEQDSLKGIRPIDPFYKLLAADNSKKPNYNSFREYIKNQPSVKSLFSMPQKEMCLKLCDINFVNKTTQSIGESITLNNAKQALKDAPVKENELSKNKSDYDLSHPGLDALQ